MQQGNGGEGLQVLVAQEECKGYRFFKNFLGRVGPKWTRPAEGGQSVTSASPAHRAPAAMPCGLHRGQGTYARLGESRGEPPCTHWNRRWKNLSVVPTLVRPDSVDTLTSSTPLSVCSRPYPNQRLPLARGTLQKLLALSILLKNILV